MTDQTAPPKKKPHEEFAEQVSEMLAAGTAPWQRPWKAGELVAPFNPVTGTIYNGINRIRLSKNDYADPRWMTFRQANEKGFKVQAGSKATPVVFWQWTDMVDLLDENGKPVLDENGKPQKVEVELDRPLVHYYAAFNAAQLRQMENGENIPPYEPQLPEWNPHEKAEAIIRDSGAVILHDQRNRAFYRPGEDAIHLPSRGSFSQAGGYYSTTLHELGHWACAAQRLNIEGGPFGSELYAKEELRAEIASWMVCQDLGLDFQPENSAAYVADWMKSLKEDPYEIVRACRDAERIKKYVLGLEMGQTLIVGAEPTAADSVLASEAAQAVPGNPAIEKVYLDVPFKEKDAARTLGATWDKEVKKWCARPGTDLNKLAKWLPQAEAARAVPSPAPEQPRTPPPPPQPEITTEKMFLSVPYREKDMARAKGAKWDKDTKLWFVPAGTDIAPLAKWIPEKEPAPTPALDPVGELAQRLTAAGFRLNGPPVMDGKIQRVPVEGGKAGAKDGAYCAYLDGQPAGWFQNHRTGEKGTWMATGHTLSPEQMAALKAENERLQAEREEEQERGYQNAANRVVLKLCDSANVQPDPERHPYLKAKGIKGFDIFQDRDGNLMVPGFDLAKCYLPGMASPTAEGPPRRPEDLTIQYRVQTLQTISPDGTKLLEPGSKKMGAMHLIGTDQFRKIAFDQWQLRREPLVENAEPQPEILMAEGYATGASLHMATGLPVAVAFDAGNFKAAAIQLREKFPKAKITICPDNDHNAKQNVGLKHAQAAALAVQGQVVMPDFTDEEKKRGLTDFNDLHQARGLEAVAALVNRPLEQSSEQAAAKGMER
jgi:antirestriction protein ArdC/phage/plasmid primase-like uncharacterized protein